MIDKRKFINMSGGEIPFGLEVLLFVIAIFVVWILMGGAKKPADTKPFITPLTDPVNPGLKYGPGETPTNYQQNLGSQYGPVDVKN
jgi:hypothetical protein